MKKKSSWVATAALVGLPLVAAAQANPADPGAAVPALGYPSAFSDYKPWQDVKPADWRAVNDIVRDAKPGGHAGHGAAPLPANPSSSAPAASPSPAAPRRQASPAPAPAPSRAGPAPQAPSGRGGHSGHGDQK